jgi:demethylmenaquinone methyltransferase/2-methoxy-6-polyprenyl-1,4-benzoquinol methylase
MSKDSKEQFYGLDEIVASYDRSAFFYDLMNRIYFFGKDKNYRSMVIDKLSLTPDSYVLDLCCGTGVNFQHLNQKVGDQGTIIGLDISARMLQQAKEKKETRQVDLIRADIGYLPFRSEIFDAVTVDFCLTITPTFDRGIGEARRVLKSKKKIGVLANYKPKNFIGNIITRIVGVMAKINFNIDLETHLSKYFFIIENKKLHGNLVQLFIGIKLI